MSSSIAHIAVGLPVEGPFDYSIPEKLQDRIAVGDRVVVNFSHARRLGFVPGLANQSAFQQLKPVEAVLDAKPLLSPAALSCAQAMAGRYGCSLGEAIEVMLPAELRKTKAIV